MSDASRAFSLAGYRALLQGFLDRGYETRLFAELDPAKSHLVVRHDIDFSLELAMDMARLEADMGIRAHYFVLLRTEFYNPCSPQDWRRLTQLRDLGHDVGLHFDAAQYPQDLSSLEVAAAAECDILERLVGQPVTTISFHRPAQTLLGLDRRLAGRLHAYQPQFFKDIAYVADSRGLFRYGHPFDHPAFAARQAMQLLTHPIWWREAEVEDKVSILDDMLENRAALLRSEMAANCAPYAEREASAAAQP
jgi:hypothetical protein